MASDSRVTQYADQPVALSISPGRPGYPLVNPSIFKTKTEVVANLATYQAEDLIATHALVHTRRFANAEEVLGFG